MSEAVEKIREALERLHNVACGYEQDDTPELSSALNQARQALLPTLAAEKKGVDDAYRYAANLFNLLAPQCEPLPTTLGVLTQLDNYIAGLHTTAHPMTEAEREKLVEEMCLAAWPLQIPPTQEHRNRMLVALAAIERRKGE